MRLRQLLTSLATLVLLGVAYFIYVSSLGQITDFPQLSAELREPMDVDQPDPRSVPAVRESEVAAVRGFGPGCAEMTSPLCIESRSKEERNQAAGRGIGLFVYAENYEISRENAKQIKMWPFSLVHIKRASDGLSEHDEITTLHGAEATLQFDREVEPFKLSDANPVGGWVEGEVTLKTNRRTADPGDDIIMFAELLHFDSGRNLIWADDAVKIVVENEMTVTGSALEVELYPPGKPGGPSSDRKAEAKVARLLRDVRFSLVVDEDENFLGSKPVEEKPTSEEGSKYEVVITSQGPFTFDLESNSARFDKLVRVLGRRPPKASGEEEGIDELQSDALTLLFDKPSDRPEDSAPLPGSVVKPAKELALRQVIATGDRVVLLSESEKLQATGNYLEYDTPSRRVTIQGEEEMVALQNNAEIHAKNLVITQGDGGQPREIVADGPNGMMDLPESEAKSPDAAPQLRVYWQGRLMMNRRPDSEQQIVHINGGVEVEHLKGALTCQELRVLLVPVKSPSMASGKKGSTRLEPIKLEAEGNVSAHSDQWAVNTETLLMDILQRHEAPPALDEESPAPVVEGSSPASVNSKPNSVKATQVSQPSAVESPVKNASASSPEKSKDPPLDIRARRVAFVLERLGGESRPVSAWAEGDVRLTQPPRNGEDRPAQMMGEQLEYLRKEGADHLELGGSDRAPATIKSVDMTLVARQRIKMDEAANRVEVSGPGYLILESDNTLTGERSKKNQPVRVDWQSLMNFDGRIAEFQGDARAKQNDARINCQIMQVTLDRKMDFKRSREGSRERDGKKVSIEFIDCDRDVEVVERKVDAQGQEISRSRILGPDLRYDHVSGSVKVGGPGSITIVEPYKPSTPPTSSAAPPKYPTVVTLISFTERMSGDRTTQTVKLYGTIDIVRSPVKDPSQPIDREKLPEDGFVIQSSSAEMAESTTASGKRYRLFNATDNVRIQSKEYWANCGRLSYDQDKDVLVLEGERDRFATFYQQTRPGQPAQSFPARRIIYRPSTKEVQTEGAGGGNVMNVGKPTRPSTERR